jgi:hypothetical protein
MALVPQRTFLGDTFRAVTAALHQFKSPVTSQYLVVPTALIAPVLPCGHNETSAAAFLVLFVFILRAKQTAFISFVTRLLKSDLLYFTAGKN